MYLPIQSVIIFICMYVKIQSKHLQILKKIDGMNIIKNENAHKKIKLCNKKLDMNTQPCFDDFMDKNFTSQGKYRFITFYVNNNKKKFF